MLQTEARAAYEEWERGRTILGNWNDIAFFAGWSAATEEAEARIAALETALRDARSMIAMLRSCVDSGESLTLSDRAALIEIFDRSAALLSRSEEAL